MKPNVLIAGNHMPYVLQRLNAQYPTFDMYGAEDPTAFLHEHGPQITGIATGSHVKADAALMDACPNLEIISSFGVGTDQIDLAAAKTRGIVVCNTPDVLNDEVANTAIMLLLTAFRKFTAYDQYVRDGRWLAEGDPPLTRGIAGKSIGIVGLGRIGKVIAQKLGVFHCDIAYFGRNEQDGVPYRFHRDLEDMARDCDALIVITPGGPATKHLIDKAVIDALGPHGILVNVSRGTVVDENALVDALKSGRLGGAGLDVFEAEPEVPAQLFDMENVVLQPHQGSATIETRKAMGDRVLDNLAAHFRGDQPISRVG